MRDDPTKFNVLCNKVRLVCVHTCLGAYEFFQLPSPPFSLQQKFCPLSYFPSRNLISSVMSTQNALRRTRPSNAAARPGQIVLDAKIKRRTKAQKAADDLALKEAQEAQEAQVQKGLERLASMQNEMEKAQEELLNKKVIPVRPKPRARKATKPVVRCGVDHTDNIIEADEANDLQEVVEIVEAVETMEAVENMEDGTTGAKKKKVTKKGGKALIKDAISNMQKKINEPSSKLEGDNANNVARVSDGKDTPAP